MAHPFQAHRQNAVEHSRVRHILGSRAGGGKVDPDLAQDRKMIKAAITGHEKRMHGSMPKSRMDRPHRAAGGRVKKKAQTIVNINVGKDHDEAREMMAPPMPMPRPVPAPMPPAGPPPGLAGPPPGLGGPPPGMPPRSMGGRAYAKGGRVFEEGKKNGTQMQHTSNKSDAKEVGRRGRVITYATGGAVEAPKGKAGMGPKLPGGAHGGMARLAKARRAAKNYAKA